MTREELRSKLLTMLGRLDGPGAKWFLTKEEAWIARGIRNRTRLDDGTILDQFLDELTKTPQ